MRTWAPVLLLALLAVSAAADSAPQRAIQAAYDKACEATRLKFVDGIRSIRARHYKVFGPDGRQEDTSDEWENYQIVLRSATSVQETVAILHFEQKDASHVSCEVQDVLSLVTGSQLGRQRHEQMETRSVDDWILTAKGWKIVATHIRHRAMAR